jgi:hypothetical protein
MAMTSSSPPWDASARSGATVAAVLAAIDTTAGRGVVVDSPPGAGKTTLVVRVAGHLAERGEPVIIVAQTNEQVDDLVSRLAESRPDLGIGRLHKTGYSLPPRALRPNVTAGEKIAGLGDLPVIVATAAKWATVKGAHWRWAIVDEAYQMRSDALFKIAGLFDQALFVGDPGQLDPFSTVATDRWAGQSWDPLLNAVDVTTAHNPGMPVHTLPISWRLSASAAPLVQAAFYPFTPFASGTAPGERRLELATAPIHGSDPIDAVLAKAAESGWGYYELDHRETLPTDREAVERIATLATRLLERGAEAYCEQVPDGRPVTPDRIAIGAARTVQVEALRAALAARGAQAAQIIVDTANRLQGREFDVTIAWHPLAGRADASAFHLETGRLCVLLSRHRHACIVVGRRGIRELLDAYPSSQPVYLGVSPKFPDGWRAHQTVLDHLLRPEYQVSVA